MHSKTDCRVDVCAGDGPEEANDGVDDDDDIDNAVDVGIVRVSLVGRKSGNWCGHEHQKSSGYKLS